MIDVYDAIIQCGSETVQISGQYDGENSEILFLSKSTNYYEWYSEYTDDMLCSESLYEQLRDDKVLVKVLKTLNLNESADYKNFIITKTGE